MHPPLETVHLGALSGKLWHASRNLLEVTLVPLGLFYLLFTVTDLNGGLFAALGWTVAALGFRVVTRAPIPAVLLLTAGLLVVRTAVGYSTGSVFLYFLQPTLQNFLFAFVLLVTVPLRRPMLARLADDFCAFPPALTENTGVRRFFRRVSLLWAGVFLAVGLAKLWALAGATLGDYLVVSTAGTYGLMTLAAGVSLLWFRRELRGEGIRLRFGAAPVPMPV